MQVRRALDTDREAFNRFIADFPTGDVLQTWEWGDLKASSGWRPIRVIGEENGQIVAVASLLKRNLPKVPKCILYASRGPVMDIANAHQFREFTDGMKKIAKQEGAILLKIDPPVEIDDKASEQSILGAGFIPVVLEGFGGTQPKCVMQLDLSPSENELMANFKPKWRYNIRLADKKGVEVDIDAGYDDLPIFYELLNETTERDGFRVRSLPYFQEMWKQLEKIGAAKLAITRYQGEPVSGAFCYKIGDRAWYTYGASSNRHRNVMPNHLMQWRLIQWAKASGCKWYDFRGVSPRKGTGDEHLEGLNRFKDGFSPRFVEYLGEYDLVLSPLWYWLWTKALPMVRGKGKKDSGGGE